MSPSFISLTSHYDYLPNIEYLQKSPDASKHGYHQTSNNYVIWHQTINFSSLNPVNFEIKPPSSDLFLPKKFGLDWDLLM